MQILNPSSHYMNCFEILLVLAYYYIYTYFIIDGVTEGRTLYLAPSVLDNSRTLSTDIVFSKFVRKKIHHYKTGNSLKTVQSPDKKK